MTDRDPYRFEDKELRGLQLEALDKRFQQRREQIRILDQRARDTGIARIRRFEDIVPLLFAHTTYKSYPEAYLERKQWDRLLRWLDTLSTHRVRDVDTTGVEDVDALIARLRGVGHNVFSTSGTTGKCSFLNQSRVDLGVTGTTMVETVRWVTGFEANKDRAVFLLMNREAPTRYAQLTGAVAAAYGREDAIYYLFDEPLRMAELNRMGALRRRIAEGSALPAEIEQAERAARERQALVELRLVHLAERILANRKGPMLLMGMWPQFFAIMQTLRARGVPDGSFHPEIAMFTGGGLKGVSLPVDYPEQIGRFFGFDPARVINVYGMQELSSPFPRCHVGRYHKPPWVILLVLDRNGERCLDPAGRVEGRMAFFDLAIDGRWGGLISGDKVLADFGPCPCGRPSPTIVEVNRYSDLPEGDDKLTCAGTMESYVRGSLAV